MQNDKPHLPSKAIGMLKRHGIVSAALGVIAFLGSMSLVLDLEGALLDQEGALMVFVLSALALQALAFVALILPAFAALRDEVKRGVIQVDLEHERRMRVKKPRWLIMAWVGLAVAYAALLVFRDMELNVGLVALLLFVVLIPGWPSFKTPAQRAYSAASLGLFGFVLTGLSGLFAGGHLARNGFIELPALEASMIAFGAAFVPGLFVAFSTIFVIGRAQHAH